MNFLFNKNRLDITLLIISYLMILVVPDNVFAHVEDTSNRGDVAIWDLIVIFFITSLSLFVLFYQMKKHLKNLDRLINIRNLAIVTYSAVVFNMVFAVWLYMGVS